MRRGLVGHEVWRGAACRELRNDFSCVAEQADGNRLFLGAGLVDNSECVVKRIGFTVEVAGLEAALNPAWPTFNCEQASAGHRCRQGLRTAHAAETGGQNPAAAEIAVVMLPARFDERFRTYPE